MKYIVFVLDSFYMNNIQDSDNYDVCCYSYFDTEDAINNNISRIATYDIGHLSFDLDDLGYDIIIAYGNNFLYLYDGLKLANGKELRKGHNLRKMLIGGAFDIELGIERNKFYYDRNKSTAELLEDQLTKEKFNILGKVVDATIGARIEGTKAMTDEESYEWHKKHARINEEGHIIISSDEIGDGSYEKFYKKH